MHIRSEIKEIKLAVRLILSTRASFTKRPCLKWTRSAHGIASLGTILIRFLASHSAFYNESKVWTINWCQTLGIFFPARQGSSEILHKAFPFLELSKFVEDIFVPSQTLTGRRTVCRVLQIRNRFGSLDLILFAYWFMGWHDSQVAAGLSQGATADTDCRCILCCQLEYAKQRFSGVRRPFPFEKKPINGRGISRVARPYYALRRTHFSFGQQHWNVYLVTPGGSLLN